MTTTGQETTSEWAVCYRPKKRRPVVLWMVISGVPREAHAGDVGAGLESWGRWPMIQARVGVGGEIVLYPRRRCPADVLEQIERSIELDARANWIEWDTIAPAMRIVSVRVPGELYAELSRSARGQGRSIQDWAVHAFREQVATERLVDHLSAPAPGAWLVEHVDAPAVTA